MGRVVGENLGSDNAEEIEAEKRRIQNALDGLKNEDVKVVQNALDLSRRQTVLYHQVLRNLISLRKNF